MKIKDVYEFYFKNYNKIEITIEMIGGIRGKSKIYNYEDFKNFISPWDNEEVIQTSFERHYTYKKAIKELRDEPFLYILYKES